MALPATTAQRLSAAHRGHWLVLELLLLWSDTTAYPAKMKRYNTGVMAGDVNG